MWGSLGSSERDSGDGGAWRGEQRRGGSETGSAAPRTFRMWKYSMGRRSASGAGRAEA